MKPKIGMMVNYQSKKNPYILPAIITATTETLWDEGVKRGDVQKLSSDTHVHLLVLTPGSALMYAESDVPMVAGPREATPGSWWFLDRL